MRNVLLALLLRFSVAAGVVVALGQAQAGGSVKADFRIRIAVVLTRAKAEEGVHANGVQVSQQSGKLVDCLQSCNPVEFGLERRESTLVDGRGIHATGILVADLLFVGGARSGGSRRGGLLENLLQMQAVQFIKLGESAVGGLVGWQRIA